jgi:NAD(P)-dependent dehydrogenase (short-subunit alcohol dehydrogenase family)
LELEEMDLMDHTSIDRFAEKFLSSGWPLHLLINNAGIMFVPLRRDSHGIESQLVTNYLAPFQLTARLWNALKKANGARVVNVSSQGTNLHLSNFKTRILITGSTKHCKVMANQRPLSICFHSN